MSANPKPKLILITGVPGAGKTTVAKALVERLQPALRVSTDCIRRKVRPLEKPWEGRAGEEQVRLGAAATSAIARIYLEGGFSAIVDDIVSGEPAQQYKALQEEFMGTAVLLRPSLEVAQGRYAERGTSPSGQHRTEELYAALDPADFDITIDTSELTVDQTVEAVLKGIS
jgi:predicted kinase